MTVEEENMMTDVLGVSAHLADVLSRLTDTSSSAERISTPTVLLLRGEGGELRFEKVAGTGFWALPFFSVFASFDNSALAVTSGFALI